jgi:hypothetical protein
MLYTYQFHNKRGIPWLAEEPKIQFLRDVTLCRSVSEAVHFFWQTLETSGVIPPTTPCHISEVLNLQHHRCESLKFRAVKLLKKDSCSADGNHRYRADPSLVNRKSDIHISPVISILLQVSADYIIHRQDGHWFTQRVKGRGLSLKRMV